MTKIFSPKNLRLYVLILFISQSFFVLSQSDVYINWGNWSSENRLEIINPSNSAVLSIEDNYVSRQNIKFLNQNSTRISSPKGSYTVKVYDDYRDDWNGTGSYAIIFVDNNQTFEFEGNLNNTATSVIEFARVTIKNLIENNKNLTFEDLIRGSQILGGLMQTTGGAEYAALGHAGCSRGVGYRTVPSHIKSGSDQGSYDDTNPGNNAYFAGDYYNSIRHGSGETSISNSVSKCVF
ncbi:hypothetical protein [uncultured Polaribacter sp.]|uniref:hypothetical protein n=1 Tax=uncultured Polaribacter sp. TaxID=174711 RepID=UPI002604285C|nr:hypothetical protein [uncultured Polaribacter sp.]